jgi:RNA polymerase sigma-70 factor (ECF subfamily)
VIPEDEGRFARLYATYGPDVLAYALRRVDRPEDAAEILADTFLVAWRRLAVIPSGAEARLWLYGVARRTLANHRRGELRRVRLTERVQAELSTAAPMGSTPEIERTIVLSALKCLDKADQEVLLLAGWEELEPAQIGRVLGIAAGTARARLFRARRRLRRELSECESAPDAAGLNAVGIEEAR